MSEHLRKIAASRRIVGDQVAHSLIPLERSAHQTAIQSSMFVSLVLEAHAQAGIPETEGMQVVTLLSEASLLAAQSRAKIGAAHIAMKTIAKKTGIEYAGPPECPKETFHVLFGQTADVPA